MRTTIVVVAVFSVLSLPACGGEIDDADKDGVADFADWCTTVVEEPNGYNDHDGCPDEVPTEPPEPLDLTIAGTWQGLLVIQRPNRDPIERSGVVIRVSGVRDHDALVRLSCYWSGLEVRTYGRGTGRTLTVEPPPPCRLDGPDTCRSRMEYGTGTLSIDAERRMTLQLDGIYEDCTGRSPATFTMRDVPPLD